TDERGLTSVLGVVVDDADEPYAEGDGRIPRPVHDAVEIGLGQALHVPDGLLVYRVVVTGEEFGGADAYGGDGLAVVTVAGRRGGERQSESVRPPTCGPDLLGSRDARDVIVLDARQVPDEPGDGVGLATDPFGELLRA